MTLNFPELPLTQSLAGMAALAAEPSPHFPLPSDSVSVHTLDFEDFHHQGVDVGRAQQHLHPHGALAAQHLEVRGGRAQEHKEHEERARHALQRHREAAEVAAAAGIKVSQNSAVSQNSRQNSAVSQTAACLHSHCIQ